jgi:hypothetical protein
LQVLDLVFPTMHTRHDMVLRHQKESTFPIDVIQIQVWATTSCVLTFCQLVVTPMAFFDVAVDAFGRTHNMML